MAEELRIGISARLRKARMKHAAGFLQFRELPSAKSCQPIGAAS
jgi:hypothetical protein